MNILAGIFILDFYYIMYTCLRQVCSYNGYFDLCFKWFIEERETIAFQLSVQNFHVITVFVRACHEF